MSAEVLSHFRLWLRAGLSGCFFAKKLATQADRVAIDLFLDENPQPDLLSSVFDANAEDDRAVIIVFPRIVNEAGLVHLLNGLSGERWRVAPRNQRSPSGSILVGLDWRTKHGDMSETMGFAPFGSMPISRRAPYAAIATWPGSHSNPMRGTGSTPPARDKVVSFLDAKHGMPDAAYEKAWSDTSARVTALMEMPPDDAKLYRRTAFVMSPDAAMGLAVAQP